MRSRVLALAVSLALVAAAATARAGNPWDGRAPYGLSMMTEEEREAYWKELRALSTVEEQQAYWLAHIEKMEQRALARGVGLPPPPVWLLKNDEQVPHPRPPYFSEIMTGEERDAYYETLEGLTDPAERADFVADHIARMRARALARGISPPSAEEYKDVLAGRTDADTVEPEDGGADPGQGGAGLGEESGAFDDEGE